VTSRQLAQLVSVAADAKKARDISTIDLRERSDMADFFVVCEGDTDRQNRAIADSIREAALDKGIKPFSVTGESDAAWILMDFIEVVVHIFLPGERAFYDLESLWKASAASRAKQKPA
jgi:ribosome-associated protein